MARAYVNPADVSTIPSVRLQLDERFPHFYPVAHLRQCIYEDWERGEWPARLPDGTLVGAHAPPISCACQKEALEGACDAVLAAPAQL
jgi:hypothetical protein